MSDDAELRPERRHSIRVHAISNSDALGYLGQQAISTAVSPEDDYRIVGGHMVRLLLEVYPTPRATRDRPSMLTPRLGTLRWSAHSVRA